MTAKMANKSISEVLRKLLQTIATTFLCRWHTGLL